MRILIIALGMCAAYPFADSKDETPKVHELNVKELKFDVKETAKLKPVKIASLKELEEAIDDADTREKIAKQVTFAKEYIVLFRWSGSGGDKLSFDLKKGEDSVDAVFTLKPGLTRDLRQHVKAFAIPNNIGHKLGM